MSLQDIAIISLEWDVVDLLESCSGYRLVGFLDPVAPAAPGDIPYLGGDEAWRELRARVPNIRIALCLDEPAAKARLFGYYGADVIETIMSPHSYVSPRAAIGHGGIIQRGATIMPNARLGKVCKVNVNGTIHHDVRIGDFCTIAPGAQILGNVTIGDRVCVGAGAIVRQRCSIGAGAFVGAGAVVVKDVPPDAVVVGVPAGRRLR